MTNHIDSILDQLEKQKSAIERAISALKEVSGGGGNIPSTRAGKTGRSRSGKRIMSAEARERISAAQRARWTKARKGVKRAKKVA